MKKAIQNVINLYRSRQELNQGLTECGLLKPYDEISACVTGVVKADAERWSKIKSMLWDSFYDFTVGPVVLYENCTDLLA